jgi:hypothetical protein
MTEHKLLLWQVIPKLKQLQSAWEKKASNPKYTIYKDGLDDGLNKIITYYTKCDNKPTNILSIGVFTAHIFVLLLIFNQ